MRGCVLPVRPERFVRPRGASMRVAPACVANPAEPTGSVGPFVADLPPPGQVPVPPVAEVRNHPNQGANRVDFGFGGEAPTAQTRLWGAARPVCSWLVLLIEDDPLQQFTVDRLLRRLGARTIVAGDGAEALLRFREDRFDLVLTDLQMPVLDGFETLTAIRAFGDLGRNVPIVGVTARGLPDDGEVCRAAGFDGFLPKPLAIEALCSLLERLRTGRG